VVWSWFGDQDSGAQKWSFSSSRFVNYFFIDLNGLGTDAHLSGLWMQTCGESFHVDCLELSSWTHRTSDTIGVRVSRLRVSSSCIEHEKLTFSRSLEFGRRKNAYR
jgi:hypothetical protein